MTGIFGRKKYDTATAQKVCSNEFGDSDFDRLNRGRATTLYRTQRGAYFLLHETCWQGERDTIDPVDIEEAMDFYEIASRIEMGFSEAFPNVLLEEA
jgi:hypothetical protein